MSTATVTATNSIISAFMLPSETRVVRFDDECILIPESQQRSRRPRMLTKSYSLPLWKKKPTPGTSDSEDNTGTSPPAEDTHVVFKVPIPIFITKSSRSPSRGRAPSSSPPTPSKPLSPCLVHRSPSSFAGPSGVQRTLPVRRPSLPLPGNDRRKEATLTIPLRACCPDCVPITEECLKEGSQWQEKFTRGARRRRSASLDNTNNIHLISGIAPASSIAGSSMGFAAVAPSSLPGHTEPAVIAGSRFPSSFALTVDEVDKRRKSLEYADEDITRIRQSLSSHISSPALARRSLLPSFSGSPTSESPDRSQPSRPQKSSPIEEEDEDQLFPLPSPRRTPNASPNASPANSLNPSPAPSPVPSPNTSTACFDGPSASKDRLTRLGSESGSEERLTSRSLTRKVAGKAPVASATGTDTLGAVPPSFVSPASSPARALSPTTSAVVPPYSPPTIPTGPSPSLSPTPVSPAANTRSNPIAHTRSSSPPPPRLFSSPSKTKPVPVPIRGRNPLSGPPSSSAARTQESTSPPPSPKVHRPSFSLPRPATFLKAGADVLKGVSSMGGGGTVGSP